MTNIFIYGSCTTRDSVEFWPEDLELQGYVARQSLVSAVAGGNTSGFNLQGIKSTFQKRMIKHDLNGAAIEQIKEAIESGAYVIWDLTDERNGFVRLEDGRICSSVAINHKELESSVTAMQHTKIADSDFLREWKKAADEFSEILGENKKYVRVNLVPWAEEFNSDDFGLMTRILNSILTKLPRGWKKNLNRYTVPDSEVPTAVFNGRLREMTNYLEQLGFVVVRLRDDEVKAALNHKWGPAPFHYDPETYRTMISKLRTSIEANL